MKLELYDKILTTYIYVPINTVQPLQTLLPFKPHLFSVFTAKKVRLGLERAKKSNLSNLNNNDYTTKTDVIITKTHLEWNEEWMKGEHDDSNDDSAN